ncbi:transglycosylase domain-containing protein, partial [Campylobacter avium]
MKGKILKSSIFIGLLLFLFLVFVFFSFDEKELLQTFNSRYSKVLYDKNKEILSAFINDDEQWHIRSDDIPSRLKTAVIEYEDKNFYSHFGVDFLAILRALKNNILTDKRSGASTISMQVVKLGSDNQRTYLNKIKEIIQSLALETKLTKDEILKLYLNNAP